jgi:tRNA (Thr-GGU) A37 N-methylase
MGRKDLPLVGLFATCSPARPNPICVSAVRIVERQGLTLRVEGLDAIDGSPVVDVKPYHPYYYAVEDARVSDWMARIMRELAGE